MILTLSNGYPYPWPRDLTLDKAEWFSENATNMRFVLRGVRALEWLHTLTIEFKDEAAMVKAQKLTGWEVWSPNVLEAKVSNNDGYEHPAVIVTQPYGDAPSTAFCGLRLKTKE